MIRSAYPYLLYLLLLIPAIIGLYALAAVARRRKLRRFGRLDSIMRLMPDASRYMGRVKLTLELIALTFIILAVARPYTPTQAGDKQDETTARGIEVMLCLDVSNSMLASSTDDPAGVSRLQRAKFILEKLIDRMSDDKVGLIVFAGDAYTQLPITSDYISAKMFLSDITTDIVPTQGTAIGAAIDMAMNSFTPESDFQKAIIVITDGENFEDDAAEEAKRAADAGIQVDVIGIGSGRGAPIPLSSDRSKFMTDQSGERVITRLDETNAKAIAKAGAGIYLNGSSGSVVSELDEQLSKLSTTEYKRAMATSPANELFPLAALLALIFLAIDGTLPYSKISWLRKFNFFSK